MNEESVTKLPGFFDIEADVTTEGLSLPDLFDVLDAEKEHTAYAILIPRASGRSDKAISLWKCDCFKEESGVTFYEAMIILDPLVFACKADSRLNALLMLGHLGVKPHHRWIPEEQIITKTKRAGR